MDHKGTDSAADNASPRPGLDFFCGMPYDFYMTHELVSLNAAFQSSETLVPLAIEMETPIICRRSKDGKEKEISFRALHDNNKGFWIKQNSWQFYIRQEDLIELRKRREELDMQAEHHYQGKEALQQSGKQVKANFGERYEEIASMDVEERRALLEESRDRLDHLIASEEVGKEEYCTVLSETSRDAASVNRSTLMEAIQMGDDAAKQHTQHIVDSTQAMVKSSTVLINNDIFNDEMLNALVQRSNGTVVQHMTRVFLNGVAILNYYNDKMLNSSLPNKIRINFNSRYRDHYHSLLRHLHKEDIHLERVFYSGMQAISEEQIHTFATGFLIHDIGKAKNIEYHEGEAAYDREIVVDHVRQGYIAVMQKTNYPREAGLITGYHHEYYGAPSGYGYHRALLAKARSINPRIQPDYCISYTLEPLLSYQTMAYFPAKLMEIIDVFDALTDPNRLYKPPMSSGDAVAFMRKYFVEEELKIDPILFDLFAQFVESQEQRAA